ncbi:CAAX prenyl protease 2-like isoform X2 [Echeneis naucrates]|uniref:CAAX prenyl protease 2 isoform X2 n=1 Tax=Echeneis naucrates TaxID=173247 RepID=UPI001113F44B|nr:CAAX prenyl protease 2-like isoform X2 [Echeneis naucrates]XP_029382568.1 CAAX prenyl protease 2-like isoform X2 [Echeneis naucrates]
MAKQKDFSLNLVSDEMTLSNGDFVAPEGLCWLSVVSCLLLACSYVGSLYVWRSDLPRDHPTVIKRRFTSVLIVSGLSPLFVWAWREFTGVRTGPSLLALMGIRFEGLTPAIILPLVLTMVLFLGPIMQLAMDCPWSLMDGIRVVFDPCFWMLCLSDMRWLRNQVVAPLTEELVFRACMLPMLIPCAGPSLAIVTCPLFFGVAHFHHVIELLRFRQGTLSGIFLSAAVFGAYTAFIFIRTGHLMGPVLCHSFCNYMGFPTISTALEHPQRLTILSSYVLGVLLFLLFLFPFTDPSYYGLPTPVCTLTSSPSSLCLS